MGLYDLMCIHCYLLEELGYIKWLLSQKKSKNLTEKLQTLRMKKADLEINIPKHKLEVGVWPQVNCFNYMNTMKTQLVL